MMLLSRPKPNTLESLRGYILRLSEANSYHTTQYVLELAGLWTGRNYDSASNYVFGSASLAKLSKVTNVPVDQLKALRYGLNNNKQSTIHHHQVANEYLRLDYPRICPACLDSKNIALAVWDIPAITVCPEHHIPLFDHCPECNTRLRWNRPGIHLCHHCECDFRSYTSNTVLLQEYSLSRLIYQLCMNKSTTTRKIPKPLLHRTFAEVLELTSCIALIDYQFSEVFQNERKFLSLKTAPNHLLHAHYCNAMKHLDNWPENFYQFLTESRQTRRRKGITDGISKEIGAPFYLIKNNRHKPAFQPLWEAYLDYREIATKQTLQELARSRLQTEYISIYSAAKQLNSRHEQLQKFCKRLKVDLRKGPGNSNFIHRKEICELKIFFDKLLSTSQAAEQLGVTAYQLRGLIRKGIIEPFRDPAVDKSRDWYFESKAIEKLLNELFRKCKRSGFSKTHKLSLKKAIEQISYFQLGLPELVSAILSGKVQAATSNRMIRLKDLKFSLDEIKALRPYCQSNTEYWQPPKIQKFLGLKKHSVFGLLNSNQLPLEKITLPGRTRPVVACHKEAVKRFKKQYISLPEIAYKLGTCTKKASLFMTSNNIDAVSGPGIDGGYCVLYNRSCTVEKLISPFTSG